jgi:hypothetical protein
VALGLTAGAVVGLHLAERHRRRHRHDLFSPRPLRRLAALGGLADEAGVETVRLLRDYLAWESHPLLRRRARAVIRRLEVALG